MADHDLDRGGAAGTGEDGVPRPAEPGAAEPGAAEPGPAEPEAAEPRRIDPPRLFGQQPPFVTRAGLGGPQPPFPQPELPDAFAPGLPLGASGGPAPGGPGAGPDDGDPYGSPDDYDAVLIKVDIGGAVLLSRITREAASSLGLRPGSRVWALVKAVSTRGHTFRAPVTPP